MKFRIKHISFLENNERSITKCSISGRFLAKSKYFGTSSARAKALTAFEFVTLPVISESDPVLTLHDGNKMRVYLGGDPFYMVAETRSIIEVHDSEAEQKRKKTESKKEPQNNAHDQTSMFGDIDIFEDLCGW